MIVPSRGQTEIDVTSRGHSRINLGDKQSVKDHIRTRLFPSQAMNTCIEKEKQIIFMYLIEIEIFST